MMLRRAALVPRRDPPIADPGLGQDQPRRGGTVRELAAQRTHVHPQVVALLRVAGTPYLPQQPLVGQQLARIRDERLQQRVLGLREMDRLAAERDQAATQVDLELAEANDRGRRLTALAPT